MKKVNLFLTFTVCFLFAALVQGQTVFGPQQVIAQNEVTAPSVVAVGDLNNDGSNDLTAISLYSYKLFLFLNDGTGNFNKPNLISDDVNLFPNNTWLVDVNNDGYLDLIYTPYSFFGRVIWRANNGTGNFGNPQFISDNSASNSPSYILDFNNDGWKDVVVVSETNNSLTFFVNNTNSSFSKTQTITTTLPSNYKFYFKDIDEDGYQDIIIDKTSTYTTDYIRNDGYGFFALTEVQFPVLPNISQLTSIDLNEDGFLDFMAISSNPLKLLSYLNNGDNTFADGQVIEEYITTYPSYSIGLHDFNGDGRLDICSFNGFNNTITWRENLGGGNFGASRVIDDDYLYKNFVLDINGDGSLDIVSMSSQTWKLSLNDGSGNFNTFPINITLDLSIIEKFLAADMDGLPGSELIVSASQSNELIWHYPLATEPNPPRYITPPAISQVTSVNLSDVNNNGTPDVLLTSSMNSTICSYSYLEDSTFAAQQTIANTYGRPLTLLPIDMDIDGDIDILACFDGQNGIAWLENDGLDNYQTLHPIASYTQTRYFEHVDLNGDGFKDIVFGKSSYWGEPQSLVWLKNLGTGYANMQHITILSLPEHAYSLSDINNDGLIDIIAYIGTESAIQWHRNLGAGIFATRQTLLAAIEPQNTMQFADIDGNNTKDMVIANFNNLTVSWYSNDGIGNFSSPNSILIESTGNTTLFDCKVIDLDNDNYPDIVLGKKWGFVNNPVTWFRNQHNSTFAAEQTIIPFAENTTLMFFADIDNDQDWDIILAHNGNSNNCKVSWHQNLLETIVNIPTLPTPPTPLTHIAPNPTQNTATLTYTATQTQPATLHLYDHSGRLLFETTLQPTAGINSYVLDMTRYPQGIYVVTLNNGIEVVAGKVARE